MKPTTITTQSNSNNNSNSNNSSTTIKDKLKNLLWRSSLTAFYYSTLDKITRVIAIRNISLYPISSSFFFFPIDLTIIYSLKSQKLLIMQLVTYFYIACFPQLRENSLFWFNYITKILCFQIDDCRTISIHSMTLMWIFTSWNNKLCCFVLYSILLKWQGKFHKEMK